MRMGRSQPRGFETGRGVPLSMIDIVFLLLIFFLCATRFRIPEGDLDSFLPRDRGTDVTVADSALHPCVVHLARVDGQIRCRADDCDLPQGRDEWLEKVTGVSGPDMNALEDHLRTRQEFNVHSLRVVINADPDVPAKYVVGVVNQCTRLDIADVALAQEELPFE